MKTKAAPFKCVALPEPLWREVVKLAREEERSVNAVLRRIVREHFERREARKSD